MKHLFQKVIIAAILVFGLSSFFILNNKKNSQKKDEIGNIRFNAEMDNGFEERETRF